MNLIRILVAAVILAGAAPARAAETGVIRGIVVNETTGEVQPGAEVTLTGGAEDGSGRTEETVSTDRRGRFRFEDLATGDDRFYVVDARHDGGLFPGSPVALPANTTETPVIDTRIKVWDTTRNPQTILLERDNLFVTPGEGGLDVIESVTVTNMTDEAYIGRGTDDRAPTLGLALPADARAGGIEMVDSDLDVPELVRTDFGAALTIAIPPGRWRFTYAYRVAGSAGTYDLSRTALYPVVQASAHATGDIEITSNRLVANGDVAIGGTSYKRWSATEAVDEGDQIQIAATAGGGRATALTAGLVAAAALALVLAGATIRRNRRAHPAPRREPPLESRDDLLREIAELDLRRKAEQIDEEEWRSRRAELKSRLAHLEPERIS